MHMGMGGSSLAPLVFRRSCSPGSPERGRLLVTVLDGYLTEGPATHPALRATRVRPRTGTRLATTLDPRFLHSTGRSHGGGPPAADDAVDAAPGIAA